jgi:hypothetical protein
MLQRVAVERTQALDRRVVVERLLVLTAARAPRPADLDSIVLGWIGCCWLDRTTRLNAYT